MLGQRGHQVATEHLDLVTDRTGGRFGQRSGRLTLGLQRERCQLGDERAHPVLDLGQPRVRQVAEPVRHALDHAGEVVVADG